MSFSCSICQWSVFVLFWGGFRWRYSKNTDTTIRQTLEHPMTSRSGTLSVFFFFSRQMRASAGRNMQKSSSVSGEIYTQERTDGSQSDTALGTVGGGSKKRRSSLSARVVAIVGNRRSRSTSQISGPGELPWQMLTQKWWHAHDVVSNVCLGYCDTTTK